MNVQVAVKMNSGPSIMLGTAAQWARIIFQGSNFPTKNPAENDSQCSIPRSEWQVFLAALNECSVPPNVIGYGDFGADHGEIKFRRKGGGSAPIRHIRYTGKKATFVFRGRESGKQGEVMILLPASSLEHTTDSTRSAIAIFSS